MPGGDFFDQLEQKALPLDDHVVPFCWSGDNTHTARVRAATGLTKLIQSYPVDTSVCLVAHSHGSNVGIIASQILAQDKNNDHRIDVFYALGTPINTDYQPNMQIISYLYNLFSFEDLIQTVLGMFKREYPPHERIANVRITINGKEPSHTQLHSPLISAWLPQLHHWLSNQKIDLTMPGIIHFSTEHAPQYALDASRKNLIERDLRLSKLILFSFRSIPLQHDPKFH